MAEFTEHDLDDSRFTRVSLCRSGFEQVRLNGATFRDVDLVEAELDRRMPERSLMRPIDPRGLSLAWDAIERLWDGTVERARSFAVRQAVVRRVIDELSPDRLQETLTSATPVAPDGGSGVTVARCLRVVLNEEWEHRLYAERDLTALTALTPPHTEI